ncbi:hypothetical protein FQN54_002423 [Arachnomyces sp. PD_36]|nr:hypothetical protein FQN54_002423 [Arachnomyces sp. PD_36]
MASVPILGPKDTNLPQEPETKSVELLDLPVELIQLFLLNATTPTFLQAVLSCRTIYDIASQCREVLLYHLERVPGLLHGLPDVPNEDLFLLLRRRACAHLYGANFYADKTTFNFPDAESGEIGGIKVSASSFATFSCEINTALVRKGGDASDGCDEVYLYHLQGQQARISGILVPPYDHPGKVEILKTRITRPCLVSVLQQYTPTSVFNQDSRLESAQTRQLLRPFREKGIHLVQHRLDSDAASDVQEPIVFAFPDHFDHIPLAMAVANETTFAISWEHINDSYSHEVIMYVVDDEELVDDSNLVSGVRYISCSGVVVVDSQGSVPVTIKNDYIGMRPTGPVQPEPSPVTHLEFGDQDSQLLYNFGASSMHKKYQNFEYSTVEDVLATEIFPNQCSVRFTGRLTLRFEIDLPFFGTHETSTPNIQPNICTWKYLSIGIATHRREGWTVACLLRSQAHVRYTRCGHVMNLKRGRRFNQWLVVARLWGYRKPSDSIGGIIATSSGGTRIAIANWNAIYVWALNPHEIIEENEAGYYRTPRATSTSPSSSFSSPSPNAEEVEKARNKSAALDETDPGMVELKPIVLPLEAVCFKLQFVEGEEDELVALTDRGAMSWSLGPSGKGRRDLKQTLPIEPSYSDDGSDDGSRDGSDDESEDGSRGSEEGEEEDEVEEQPARKKLHVTGEAE